MHWRLMLSMQDHIKGFSEASAGVECQHGQVELECSGEHFMIGTLLGMPG